MVSGYIVVAAVLKVFYVTREQHAGSLIRRGSFRDARFFRTRVGCLLYKMFLCSRLL